MKSYLLPIITVLVLTSGCSVVSFHKLTTDFSGVLLKSGVPIEGAEILFKANSHWYGEWEGKIILTDSDGKFKVPQWKLTRPFVFVHQPVIRQTITIKTNDATYLGWQYTRMSYSDDLDSENGTFLKCDLGIISTSNTICSAH